MHLVIHDASLRKVAFVDNTKQNTLKYIKYEWYRSSIKIPSDPVKSSPVPCRLPITPAA